jgi:hypothetical protein
MGSIQVFLKQRRFWLNLIYALKFAFSAVFNVEGGD